jgi:hypothetical protein
MTDYHKGFFISNDVKVIGLCLVKSGSWSFITYGWCGRSCKDWRLCGRQNRLCKTPQRVAGRIYGTRSPGSERFREVLKRESSIGLEKPLNIADCRNIAAVVSCGRLACSPTTCRRHTSLAEPFTIGIPAMLLNNPYIVMVSDDPEASAAFQQHEKKLTLGKAEAIPQNGTS